MTQQLVSIPFHGSSITATSDQRVALKPFVMPPLVDASGHPLPDLQQGRDWR